MPVIRFSHVNLRAPRAMVDALRDFYCEVVGLQCGPRPLSSYGYWLYAGGCEVLHLSESRPGENRGTGALTTFDHAAFPAPTATPTSGCSMPAGSPIARWNIAKRVWCRFFSPTRPATAWNCNSCQRPGSGRNWKLGLLKCGGAPTVQMQRSTIPVWQCSGLSPPNGTEPRSP